MTSIAVKLRQCGSPDVSFTSPASNITRKSSQRTMRRAMGRGGEDAPSPGRNPAGANGMHSSAASSISRSSCAAENTRQVETNDTKIAQQAKRASRGHRFSTSASAAMNPTQARNQIMPPLVPSQKRLGARMNASKAWGNDWWSWAKNSPSGAMPRGPISAWPSRRMPPKTNRYTTPTARRTIHRGHR